MAFPCRGGHDARARVTEAACRTGSPPEGLPGWTCLRGGLLELHGFQEVRFRNRLGVGGLDRRVRGPYDPLQRRKVPGTVSAARRGRVTPTPPFPSPAGAGSSASAAPCR